MNSPKDSLLLIDGHAVLYRAFHALPPLTTKNGQPTNAVYGFITTLLKAIEDIKPKYCAVAFDVSGPTFRHQTFAGYKASRPDTPPDLLSQVPLAYKVTEALSLPIFTKEGFEADDVIGTLAAQAKKEKVPVVIVTGDKDSFQLVDDATFVYIMRRTMTDTTLYDPEGVKERMGIWPEQVPDYKALAGDASDEIPGIAGIGEKTATTLLANNRTIDQLYDDLKLGKTVDSVSDRIKQKVIEGEEIARTSRGLATIDRTVPISLELKKCSINNYDAEKMTQVLNELEFYSLAQRIPQVFGTSTVDVPTQKRDWKYKTVMTEKELQDMVTELKKSKTLVIDTETDGLQGKLIGISLAAKSNYGYYIPTIADHGAVLTPDRIAEILRPLIEDRSIAKAGHNLKYDMASLKSIGLNVDPVSFDTMVAAYIVQSHLRSFDLDSVALREFGYRMIPYIDAAGSKSASLATAPIEQVAEYAAEDAIITYRLYEYFQKQLTDNPKLLSVALKIDFPLIPVLLMMEERGVRVDRSQLKELETNLDKEITQLRARIESYAKTPININSPAQLQKLLFEDLGLQKEGMKATQSGVSTAAQQLEKLQGLHPVIDDILRYRELTKLQSTYVQTLPELVDTTGRIHTRFSQTTAATGRLASHDPNLQNIPIRTDLGNEIRKAFTAPEGWQLLSLDYSQIELRIIAHLSGDKNLKQVFLDGRDIHDEVAKKLGVDRRAAKAINFGIFYGLSPFGLSQGLKIDQKTAKDYIDAYLATFSGVADYLKQTKQEIRDKGYVETLFGRRREIPEIKASNAIVRAAAERVAINAPVQGTQADLIKLAMIETIKWIGETYRDKKERPYLVLQVHDELLFEVPKDQVPETAKRVKDIMENAFTLSVPIKTEAKVGPNWGEMKKLEV